MIQCALHSEPTLCILLHSNGYHLYFQMMLKSKACTTEQIKGFPSVSQNTASTKTLATNLTEKLFSILCLQRFQVFFFFLLFVHVAQYHFSLSLGASSKTQRTWEHLIAHLNVSQCTMVVPSSCPLQMQYSFAALKKEEKKRKKETKLAEKKNLEKNE